jgi:arginine decarboxylase
VALEDAIGRVSAEQITPYLPGIPALVPGERITAGIVECLRTGVAAGMVLPDPADPGLSTIRVTALP